MPYTGQIGRGISLRAPDFTDLHATLSIYTVSIDRYQVRCQWIHNRGCCFTIASMDIFVCIYLFSCWFISCRYL